MDEPRREQQRWGPIMGIIIIVALLIAGGAYFLLSGEAGPPATSPSGFAQRQ